MKRITLACLLGLLISSYALAIETVTTNEVTVTATRFPETEPRTPGNFSIITQQDIRSTPGISIPDVLKTRAGIKVSNFYSNQGIDSTVDIRGFGDSALSNTLILLDGQRLNPLDASTIQWASIPLQALDRIEIIRGGGSVLYGDRASGGVINLITDKSGRDALSATGSMGSYGYKALDGYVSGSDNGFYYSSFLHSADSNGYRENTESAVLTLNGRVGEREEGHDVFVDYSVYRMDAGLPGSINRKTYHNDPRGARTPFDSQEKKGYRIRPGIALAITDKLRFEGEIAATGEQYDYINPSFGAGSTSDRSLRTISLTPRMSWLHGLGKLPSQTIFGFDYYYGEVHADASSFASQDARQISKAFYLQNTTSLTTRLSLTTGYRTQNMQQEATQDAFTGGFFPTPAASGSSDRTRNVYDLGLSYHADQWSTYAKTGSSFRFANTDELFGFDAFFNPVFAGDIKPQYARHKEIGARFALGSLDSKVAIFRADVDDEIGYDAFLGINSNLDPTRRNGFETELGWKFTEQLQSRIVYTYIDAEFRRGPYDGNRIPSVANNTANAQLIWDSGRYGSYTAQLNYVGTRFSSGDFTNTLDKQPSYTTLDLRANWDFHPLHLSLVGLNVTDKRYSTFSTPDMFRTDIFYFPADGRSFYVSARYDFK